MTRLDLSRDHSFQDISFGDLNATKILAKAKFMNILFYRFENYGYHDEHVILIYAKKLRIESECEFYIAFYHFKFWDLNPVERLSSFPLLLLNTSRHLTICKNGPIDIIPSGAVFSFLNE